MIAKFQCHQLRRAALHLRRQSLSTRSNNGYKSFGSFHSDNVEELIRIPKEQYIPPELPFDTDTIEDGPNITPSKSSSEPFANSHEYIRSYSHLDREQWTFLNHGAFGLALDVGLQRAHSWRISLESQPLRHFDRHLLNHLAHGARCMVDFVTKDEVGASRIREGTALIQNVTSGMNAVIGGHARCENRNRLVFYYDIAYGSNKKMAQTYHGKENAIAIPFEDYYIPLLQKCSATTTNANDADWNSDSTDIFLAALDATIHKYTSQNNIGGASSVAGSLLVLDHITSNTAIRLPIAAIAKYAKEEYGMVVAVDGAHALLGLPLDMGSILSNSSSQQQQGDSGYVDIYLTNAHKWFSSTRGAALLFCANDEIRDTILAQPSVVSHGVDDGFLSRFMWDGCRDYSSQLSLPAVLDYWNAANVDTVREELQRNLNEGVRILVSHWHPGVCSDNGDQADAHCVEKNSAEAGLTLVPLDMHAPMMALVRLPVNIGGLPRVDIEQKTSTDAKHVQDFLYSHNVEVPIKCISGALYARVSCHVYNTADEFERLARAALKY
ncbi:hypothetical protein ACHAXR_005444 [Thalassiosira sp. AJA248-18]